MMYVRAAQSQSLLLAKLGGDQDFGDAAENCGLVDCKRNDFGIEDESNPIRHPTISHFMAWLQPILPAFLKRGGLSRHQKISQSPTAYLDGLRGWAAFLVVFYHSGKADGRPWLQLPFIHILDAGHSCVVVFFVISGYVLTYRTLKLAREQKPIAILDSLASAVFRRYLRLYLPTAFATLLVAFAMQLGLLPHPPTVKKANIVLQLVHWFNDTVYASDPFADVRGYWHLGVFRTTYLDQMWTIPVEFRGSMILFLYTTGVIRTPTRTRIALTVLTILATYMWAVAWIGIFLAGMLAADISLSFSSSTPVLPRAQTTTSEETPRRTYSILEHIIYISLFVLAIFILSQPDVLGRDGESAIWRFMSGAIPAYWGTEGREYFYLLPGAFLLVLILDFYKPLQAPLRHRFSQYLGTVSFGLYATHLPIIWMIEIRFVRSYCRDVLGDPLWAAVLTLIPLYVVILWAADWFTRVDTLLVAWVRKLQKKCFAEWERESIKAF